MKQSCPQGLTIGDLQELFGDRLPEFNRWMAGQTMGFCQGWEFHHEREHIPECGHHPGDPFTWECGYPGGGTIMPTACKDMPHGVVVYWWDVERFLAGLPVID